MKVADLKSEIDALEALMVALDTATANPSVDAFARILADPRFLPLLGAGHRKHLVSAIQIGSDWIGAIEAVRMVVEDVRSAREGDIKLLALKERRDDV